jgi:lipid-A-disaccharide synthase
MSNHSLKFYIVAGEASGDLHGAHLIQEIKKTCPQATFRCWGGDKMQKEGATLVKHISELAFMGFVEVLFNLRTIFKNLRLCKQDILHYRPDALLLIDYPGFNLRIATWAKANGIKVHYYISPQIWAWKQSRVHKIKASIDHMYVILPFEKEFYKRFDYEVEYVGNPLVDVIQEHFHAARTKEVFFSENKLDPNKKIIALLPGSRKQEIRVKLPIMLDAMNNGSNYQLVVAGAPSLEKSFYSPFIRENVQIVYGQTYDLLHFAEAAIVTSGTATLETAIIGCPQVVCYKGSFFSYLIARMLIKVNYISLVNLIMNKELVKELIQQDCNATRIKEELDALLNNQSNRERLLSEYKELKILLGQGGASQKVAFSVLKTIE